MYVDDKPFEPPADDDLRPEAGEDDGRPVDGSVDPNEIPDLTLPSGGRVVFAHLGQLTRNSVTYLRKALDTEGNGSMMNELHQRGFEVLIKGWDVIGANGKPIDTLPRNHKSAAGGLAAPDSAALEKHIEPFLLRLVKGK